MGSDLVTLSTHTNVTEAYLIINRLKEINIPATLADANTVGMDFLLGNAVQWIKVQVREEDVERALDFLEQNEESTVAEDDIPWDQAEPEADEDPAEVQARIDAQKVPFLEPIVDADIERWVNAGYRCALFGLIFVPMSVISLGLLFFVAFKLNDLTPTQNRRFYTGLILDLVVLTMVSLLVCGGFGW